MIDVEPAIRDELEHRVPPPAPELASWEDVLERAGVRPRRTHSTRRVLVVTGALLAVTVAVASAYAVGRHFLVGDPAPPEVKAQAALLNEVKGELIPRVRSGPDILAERTRLAASLDASTGPIYLWVAPTSRGNYCLYTQIVGTELPDGRPNLSGGCGGGRPPIDSTLSGSRVRDEGWLALVYGRVDQPVQRLDVRLKGETHRVPLSGRFFLFELPGVASGELPDVELIGYDAGGGEVARREHGVPPEFRRPPRTIDVSGETPLLEIETRRTRKPISLYVVERDGERCQVLVGPGGTSTGCGGREPEPREIPLGLTQIGSAPLGMLLLWGQVGSELASLELRFEAGRVERLPLTEHFTLYQIDPGDFVPGRRPLAIVGRNKTGEVVAERELGPWKD